MFKTSTQIIATDILLHARDSYIRFAAPPMQNARAVIAHGLIEALDVLEVDSIFKSFGHRSPLQFL